MKNTIVALVVAGLAPGLALAAAGCGGSLAPLGNGDGGASGSGSGSGGLSSSGSGGISSSSSGGVSSSSSGGISSSSSGGTSSSSSSGASSSSSGGTSSSSSSGGSSSSSGGSSSSSGGSSGSGTGEIDFEWCTGTSTLCTNAAFDFYAAFTAGSQTSCAPTTTSGSCSFYDCGTSSQTGVSAGTLTIAGGSLGTGVAVTPESGDEEYSYSSTTNTLVPGQTFTVSASGGTVPAFGPQSVTAPALVTLTSPAAVSGNYTIATAMELGVAWTGWQAGAQMILEGASNSGSYFLCTWDASLGEGTVPQAVLAGLAGQSSGYLAYGQYTSTAFTSGSYSISLLALPFTGATATFE